MEIYCIHLVDAKRIVGPCSEKEANDLAKLLKETKPWIVVNVKRMINYQEFVDWVKTGKEPDDLSTSKSNR